MASRANDCPSYFAEERGFRYNPVQRGWTIQRIETIRVFSGLQTSEPYLPLERSVSQSVSRLAILLVLCLPACAQTWFSNISKSSTTTSCTIGWTTAVPTIAHLDYGLAAGSYTKSTANSNQYWRTKTQMISGLTPGKTYHFRVVASDTSQDWVNSLDYTCTTTGTTTSHSVQLNWNASTSSGVSGYRVYRSTVSGGYYALIGSPSGPGFTDTAVQSGATYYYVVAALNSSGKQSPYSNQVTAAIP